jgi:hypothetical protein
MTTETPRQEVLTEAVLNALGDAPVRAALFITFQLEPGFFEDAILSPLLSVEQRGSQRVRRVLLEERLREVEDVLVLYDRDGLIPDAPLRQRVRALPVDWSGGVLHAKHALLLQEGRLVLLTTSANLTRSGWWENIEVADVEVIAQSSSLRDDLLQLLRRLKALTPDEPQPALEQVQAFLNTVTQTKGLPRLWTGEQPLPEFLRQHTREIKRLELIAPFTDGEARPVQQLKEALQPKKIVAWVPRDSGEKVAASQGWLDGVLQLPEGRLGELSIDRALSKDRLRFVHAKVIHVIGEGQSWLLSGSPNLSNQGHAGAWSGIGRANIETAILRADRGGRWLKVLKETDHIQGQESPEPAEDRKLGRTLPVRVRYDWRDGSASARADRERTVNLGEAVQAREAPVAFATVQVSAEWSPIAPMPVAEALASSNVISVWEEGGIPCPILVEELGTAQRPSRVTAELTASDILEHWSLFSPEQRAAHSEAILDRGGGDDVEAPQRGRPEVAQVGPTMFDAFAGVLHAFLMLRQRLSEAMNQERLALVEHLVLGRQHDSLLTLLDAIESDEREGDSHKTRRLVVLLCAAEVVEEVQRRCPALWDASPKITAALRERLAREEEAWADLALPPAFRAWFKEMWTGGAA